MIKESISQVMRTEHARLLNMLMRTISLINSNRSEAYKSFSQLKWNVEKHFFVEEKAIFTAYSSKFNAGGKEVNLIAEHKEMLVLLKEADKQFEKGKNPDLSEFKGIIVHHQNIEDSFFYEGLEENLDEDEKQRLYGRLKR